MFWMWCSAVRVEMNSSVAISADVRPSVRRRSTPSSRLLRPPGRFSRMRGLGSRRGAAIGRRGGKEGPGGADLAAGVDGSSVEVEGGPFGNELPGPPGLDLRGDPTFETGQLGDVVE